MKKNQYHLKKGALYYKMISIKCSRQTFLSAMLPVSNEPWRTRTAFVSPHWSLQVFAFHARKAEVDAAVVNIFNELGLVALV